MDGDHGLTGVPPESAVFRRAMGMFPTGVALITQGHGEATEVIAANSVVSVSLYPILVLISVKTEGRMRPRIEDRGSFTINLLGACQQSSRRSSPDGTGRAGRKRPACTPACSEPSRRRARSRRGACECRGDMFIGEEMLAQEGLVDRSSYQAADDEPALDSSVDPA